VKQVDDDAAPATCTSDAGVAGTATSVQRALSPAAFFRRQQDAESISRLWRGTRI
jgi:hypothetical protein